VNINSTLAFGNAAILLGGYFLQHSINMSQNFIPMNNNVALK
jgi:hypothetical protein